MTLSRPCVKPWLLLALAAPLLAGCPLAGKSANTKPSTAKPTTTTSASSAPSKAAPKPAVASVDTTEANFNKAVDAMRARNYTQAEPLLADLTQKQPQLAAPWLNLGILYARTNRKPQAILTLRKGLALSPNHAAAQNQLGILLRENGELKAAEQAYQAALANSPEHANAHLNLGVLYDVHLKQAALALKHYEQYQRLMPSDGARVAVWMADLKQRTQAKP